MDRLFLDANVLFSAAYRPHAALRRLWELGDVELVTSSYALEEARVNLQEPMQRECLEQLPHAVRIIAGFINRPLPEAVTLPDKDRPILLAAIDARATHLLTGDFRDFGPYYGQAIEGVLILSPAAYLRSRS
jgi:predicted nucleic acid-binding protein